MKDTLNENKDQGKFFLEFSDYQESDACNHTVLSFYQFIFSSLETFERHFVEQVRACKRKREENFEQGDDFIKYSSKLSAKKSLMQRWITWNLFWSKSVFSNENVWPPYEKLMEQLKTVAQEIDFWFESKTLPTNVKYRTDSLSMEQPKLSSVILYAHPTFHFVYDYSGSIIFF